MKKLELTIEIHSQVEEELERMSELIRQGWIIKKNFN